MHSNGQLLSASAAPRLRAAIRQFSDDITTRDTPPAVTSSEQAGSSEAPRVKVFKEKYWDQYASYYGSGNAHSGGDKNADGKHFSTDSSSGSGDGSSGEGRRDEPWMGSSAGDLTDRDLLQRGNQPLESRHEPPPSTARLSHTDAAGRASMVDVSGKPITKRTAAASALVSLGPTAFGLLRLNQIGKGDVLTVAQVAGIQAAKSTWNLIPLCHSLSLSRVGVWLTLDHHRHAVHIRSEVTCVGQTGAEMEAMTAVAVAALTVYDMCKAVSKEIEISHVRLEAKSGGRSGDYQRRDEDAQKKR